MPKKKTAENEYVCRWPGCKKKIPSVLWACPDHWFLIPKALRRSIWATFEPGREAKGARPSKAYRHAERDVRNWIAEHIAQDSKGTTDEHANRNEDSLRECRRRSEAP